MIVYQSKSNFIFLSAAMSFDGCSESSDPGIITLVNVIVDLVVFTLLPVPQRPGVVDIGLNTM